MDINKKHYGYIDQLTNVCFQGDLCCLQIENDVKYF